MAILSDYFEPKLLDHIFQKAEYTRTNLYLGISTSAFSESDNGTTAAAKEPGYDSSGPTYFGDNYSRVGINGIAGNDNSSDKIKNSSGIDFAEAGGSGWGDIAYWAIFDGNSSSANMLMHGSFSASVTVASGSQFRISTGDLEIIFPTILNNANVNADARFWRHQLAYRMGFDKQKSSSGDFSHTNEYKFDFYASNASGFTDINLYLGVSASAFPTGAGLTASENTGTNYSRVLINGATWNAASTSGSGVTTISNTSAISFPEAGSNWGDMAYWDIFRGSSDTSSGSTNTSAAQYLSNSTFSKQPLLMGSLSTSKTVNTGDVLRFGQGDFVVTAS
jgi:hypothetical protein